MTEVEFFTYLLKHTENGDITWEASSKKFYDKDRGEENYYTGITYLKFDNLVLYRDNTSYRIGNIRYSYGIGSEVGYIKDKIFALVDVKERFLDEEINHINDVIKANKNNIS